MECINKAAFMVETLLEEVADNKIVLDGIHQGISEILEYIFLARLFVFLFSFIDFSDFLTRFTHSGWSVFLFTLLLIFIIIFFFRNFLGTTLHLGNSMSWFYFNLTLANTIFSLRTGYRNCITSFLFLFNIWNGIHWLLLLFIRLCIHNWHVSIILLLLLIRRESNTSINLLIWVHSIHVLPIAEILVITSGNELTCNLIWFHK